MSKDEDRALLGGQRVLVTGGSRGIGAAIVAELHRAGARVVINYRAAADEAIARQDACNAIRPDSALACQADVSNAESVAALFGAMDAWCGGIDILVNNAGFESVGHLLDLELAQWNRVIDVNLTGAFLCTQEAGRRMVKTPGDSVIVNVSSIHDSVPRKGFAHYAVAKAGLHMLTKATALELAEAGVRAVTVSPGAIATEMNRDEIAEFGEDRFREWIPAGRIGEVADVAPLVAFLCGPHARYMSGTNIYVDGAYLQGLVQYDPRPESRWTASP